MVAATIYNAYRVVSLTFNVELISTYIYIYNDLNYVHQVYLICIYVRWSSLPTTAALVTTAPMASNAAMVICASNLETDEQSVLKEGCFPCVPKPLPDEDQHQGG